MADSAQNDMSSTGRRPRRTKADIVQCLDQAAQQEIAEHGFLSALVTNIIRKADIEPQVFYNRYKDLSEFYASFVRKYDTWINDLQAQVHAPLLTREGLSEFIHLLIDALHDDPVMLELVRWELTSKNPTTMRTSALRDMTMVPALRGFSRKFKNSHINPGDMLALIAGGIYFQALHSKIGPFRGLDFNTTEGREGLETAVNEIIELMYASIDDELTARERRAVERLRAAGVSDQVIAEAFDLT